jgi:hypothetical protein
MLSIDHFQALKRVFPCCQGNVVDGAPGPGWGWPGAGLIHHCNRGSQYAADGYCDIQSNSPWGSWIA